MEKEQKAKSKPSFISDLIVPPALIPIVFHTPFLRSLALARVHAPSRNSPGPKERVYLVSVFHVFLFFLFLSRNLIWTLLYLEQQGWTRRGFKYRAITVGLRNADDRRDSQHSVNSLSDPARGAFFIVRQTRRVFSFHRRPIQPELGSNE